MSDKIGFTGTRNGMTDRQLDMLRQLLDEREGEFHHGDCVGADAQAHDIADDLNYYVVAHPPDKKRLRAFKQAHRTMHPKPYHERNRDIVDTVEELIATPDEYRERQGSGTWSTVRYARRCQRKLVIIWPDGRTKWEFA